MLKHLAHLSVGITVVACGPIVREKDGEPTNNSLNPSPLAYAGNEKQMVEAPDVPKGRRLLQEAEIRKALVNNRFMIITSDDRQQPYRISLASDGTAALWGHRAPIDATYSIDGATLCITPRSSRAFCSRFYKFADGALYQEYVDRPGQYFKLRWLD